MFVMDNFEACECLVKTIAPFVIQPLNNELFDKLKIKNVYSLNWRCCKIAIFISPARMSCRMQKYYILICIGLNFTKFVCAAFVCCVRQSLMHIYKNAIYQA